MAIRFNCDICTLEIEETDRVRVQIPFARVADICPSCMNGLKLSIELAKVGPHWEQIASLHKQVFSERMKNLRAKHGVAKR